MKNSRKQLILFSLMLTLLSIGFTSHSQYVLGGFVGGSDYSGDLANTPLDMKEMQLGGGVYAGYYLDDYFQVRARLTYQKISAHDKDQRSTATRNLSFQSNIIEFAGLISYEYDNFERLEYRFKPYVYSGVAVYKHNPKAEIDGRLVELQPLGTEGQGIAGFGQRYRLTDIAIPFGGGIKYKFGDHIIAEVNLDAKKVFSDYLDDVSGQEYVAPSILIQNGQDAVDVAYKADEIGGRPYTDFESAQVRSSFPRNQSRLDDWYYLFGVGASYYIPPVKRSKMPKNRKGVPNKY